MYDIAIVGAGPVGSYAAYLLSQKGFKVLVLEEHSIIGEPVHCTGIVGEKLISEFLIPQEIIQRRIDSVLVHFPSGKSTSLPTPIKPYILNRKALDQFMAQKASQSGATIILDAFVEEVKQDRDSVTIKYLTNKRKNQNIEKVSLCILACGAISHLPIKFGFRSSHPSYLTAQVDAEAKNTGIELYLGKDFAPGSFAYTVSINGTTSKIGIIVKDKPKEHFQRFINFLKKEKKVFDTKYVPIFRPLPFGVPNSTVKGRILAVGDAASQLKTTTGGGVYYGLKGATILAKVIEEAYTGTNFDISYLRLYDKLWKREMSQEIEVGLILRSLLERVDDSWWNQVYEVIEKEDIKELIRQYKDFDSHYPFIAKFFKMKHARDSLLSLIRANLSNGKTFLKILGISLGI